ncbi:MAG: hypothetical protein GXC94_16130 [Comamonadaceae bacterium]|nr:hypothetical protein [Comamonadaceae bacterium]
MAAVAGRFTPAEQALAQRMQADWCGFGAAAERQKEALPVGGERIGPAEMAMQRETLGERVLEEAREQARQRFAQALRQRGDLRSLALADYVLADAPARSRLQERARRSTDPMVTALALQRPCSEAGCAPIEASQWSRLEPANLQAWLTLMQGAPGRAHTQRDYALERAASEARYSRSYQRETLALLMTLPLVQAPGLVSQAELELLNGLNSAWALPAYRPLLDACRAGVREPQSVARCTVVADLMWAQETMIERALAMAVARVVLPSRSGLRPIWEGRARRYEAVSEWSQSGMLAQLLPDEALASPCGHLPAMRTMLVDLAERGEWGRTADGLRDAGLDEAELSARWRHKAGRSALEPSRPASAAGR